MYVEKVKRKKDMFDILFISQCISTPIFWVIQKYFIKIIFVCKIIMVDKFLIQLEVVIRTCRFF